MGLGVIVIGLLTKTLYFLLFSWIFQFRIFELENTWWMWVLLLFADDFSFYWHHRLSHEVRILWAAHVQHHSSQRLNLAVALRQSWGEPFYKYLFYCWIPLLGFDPIYIFIMQAISLIYQFFQHTELVGNLGPIEWIFNTPSHHRVHHAVQHQYLDRNHAGILIIWDRLFGTFVQEKKEEKPIYGITNNIDSFNPLTIATHEYVNIWKDVKKLIKDLLKKNNIDSSQILSIGISNQRETTVMWDKTNGIPINRAIVWQDRRTNDICKKLRNQKLEKKVQKITGLIIDPYFSATKIKWILDNNPKAKKLIKEKKLLFGTIDTWLLWNLTERKSHLTDITNASRTMLYDLENENWSHEILRSLNIPKDILPEVTQNTYDFGSTNLFGDSIPIGGMAGDQQSATIGQACFKKGQSKSTYGTGCFLLMNIGEKFKLSKNRLLTTVAFKINGKKMFCYEGSIFVAGSAIQWLRDNLKFIKDSSETDKLYKRANKDESLFFVPALTGLGAPYWNPNARGTFFGITRNTSKEDIIKATLDSLSFQTYELIECMEKDSKTKISEIRVDGGMVKNNSFLQSLANISQIKIIRPSNIETTSLGAAYLAAIQSGYLKNTSQISKLWKKDKTVKANINKSISTSSISKWKSIINVVNNFY